MNQQLFSINLNGTGTIKEIKHVLQLALREIDRNNSGDIEINERDISAEILELCPYHEIDTRD